MKTKFFSRTLSLILALIMVLGMVPLSALATDTEAAAQAESGETRYLLYSEDFDSYTTRVDLVNGTNDIGWEYSQKSTNGYAYIENGKLYFAGSKYDVLYRAGGENWGNYTVEADISYNTDNAGWAGLAYNVQSGTKFQKASVSTSSVGLNGYDAAYSGGWTNNDATLNKTTLTALGLTNSFASSQMRFKISVYNTSATLWIAQYTDGVLGSWVEAKSIDNIYEDAQTGSIGFMSSNGSLGSIIVDNIKVYADGLVSFTEDFDEYEGTSLTVGENGGADGIGIYFSKGQDKYAPTSYVQDGRLYLDARSTTSTYEHLYFMTGMNWTDYIVEMDYCEIGATGWIGMLYRVGGPFSFQKTGINFNGVTSLYGFTGSATAPQWHHNTAPNKITQTNVVPTEGEPIRMKIVVNGQSATLYAALYNDDGTVNEYTQIMSVSNLYSGHTTGSIGLMLCSGQTNLKAAWIDNVVVSRYDAGEVMPEEETFTVTYVADGVTVDILTVNAGGSVSAVPAVPAKEGYTGAWDHDGTNITADTVINAVYTEIVPEIDPVVADIYLPQTGIINPPTVVQSVTTALPATSGRTPAVALMEIDESLNIEGVNSTVADFFATYINTVIPAFVVDSQTEADALIAYLNENKIIDAFVVADSENAALVKHVRQACPQVRGAIRFDAISDNQAVLNTVNENLAYVAISETPVALETVTYFHLRQRAVWCVAADTADMYQAIAAGWSGMISTDTDAVYDFYASITEITITGQALPIAHRGEHITTPENTLEAFRSAVNNYGVLAVETDLRLTADGDIILDHDGSLDRTTDYENRTDVFTKGNLTSSYTVEELKQLNVDYMGGTYQLATFEEALAEFADSGLVFYAHINGTDAQIPGIISRLEELLEAYDAYDNVVFFIGYAYHDAFNAMAGTVTDKISVTVGHTDTLTASSDPQECVENFINELAVDNCQPLFYNYGEHKGWNFYYKLSARGFVNSHSISNTQAYLDGIFLRDWGVVGALTDDINLTTSYAHKIVAEDSQIIAGQLVDTTYDLLQTVGKTEQIECDFIQLSGPELVNGRMQEAGEATVVFYTTATTPSGGDYRVYSEPVTITAMDGVAVEQWNITLQDDICPNFHLLISDGIVSNTVIYVSVGADTPVSYNAADLTKTEAGYYVVSAPLAAAQMTDEIKLQFVVNGEEALVKTYTVAQYGVAVLSNENMAEHHAIVKAMLNYGAKAQLYFNYNAQNLADAGYETAVPVAVPADALTASKEGSISGISYFGASLVFVNKIAVRYYFETDSDINGYAFTVNGTSYAPVSRGGMYYVEIPGINPQEYQNVIYLTVSDGSSALTIGYSPMHYITRVYNRETSADSLKNLTAALYGYHLAAKEYVDQKNYISILGDSISTYVGVSNDSTANSTIAGNNVYYTAGRHGVYQADTWWQQVIDSTDLELLVNNSWSGSCILSERSGTVGAYIDRCVQLHNNSGATPDVIAVFLGTNDFTNFPDTLGSAETIDYNALIIDNGDGTYTYAEPTTSCEAYAVMLHKMKIRYPDAQILCMTLLARREDAAAGQPTAFNDDLKSIARRFGCTVVDLENCGIKPNAANYDTYMAEWGVHPNTLGMDKISEAVLAVLQQDEIVAELNGKDLTVTDSGYAYALGSDRWTLEGRLAIDFNTVPFNEKDYRVYAGADGFDQAVAVLYSYKNNNWYLQNQTTWNNIVLTEDEANLLNAENGGLWVRWIRSGSTLTLRISTDGVNWTRSVSHYGITDNDLYIKSTQSLGTQLLNTSFSTEAVFTQQKQTTMEIPGDYTDASYAVFEANIKALDPITYDWGSNILISPSGAVWDAYDFQILYGTSSEQNLIKLTGSTTTKDGATAEQEQWINNPNLEKIFSEDGMNIKLVRFNTWAYLLVDMGSGYELVGRMYLPADQATQFAVFNHNTAIEVSDYSIKTGEAAAAEALSGLNLTIDTNLYVFPVESDSWTLEGRLVIDTDNFPWWEQDYRMYAGANGWDQAVSVFYSASNVWYLQNHTSWSNTVLPDEEWWMVSEQKGGMWVRFDKSGSTLTVSTSKDGENWTTSLSHDSITAKGIYLYATLASELRDIQLTIGE